MSFSRINFETEARRLGHSDRFIHECIEYATHLDAKGLPVIFSRLHFAQILDLRVQELDKIIKHRPFYYRTYSIRKRRGGLREISSPTASLKNIQNWIKINILSKIEPHQSCLSFRIGKSILDNAAIHVGQEAILKVDIKDFFPSISEKRIFNLFKSFGYHTNLAVDFAKFCTMTKKPDMDDFDFSNFYDQDFDSSNGFLPQGAPTSPAISNLIGLSLDVSLSRLAEERGINYSRYADDITFSGKPMSFPSIPLLKSIFADKKFILHPSKIVFTKTGMRQTITGLSVADKVTVPKKFKKSVWRHLFFCLKFGPNAHQKSLGISEKRGFREWLMGKIFFIKMIEPEVGEKMLLKFNEITWIDSDRI